MVETTPLESELAAVKPKGLSKSFASVADLRAFIVGCASQGLVVVPGRQCALPGQSLLRPDFFVQASELSGLLEHSLSDQVISLEAGITIGVLAKVLAEHKQWFPVPEAYGDLSLMEVIDRSLAGSLEHRFGGLRELVLGLDVLLSSGELIKCGGKVVKNVSGYDLTKLFTGARGSLGMVLAAHLRLFALPEESRTVCFSFQDLTSAQSAALKLLAAGLPLSCLEIADCRLVADGAQESMAYVCVQTHGAHQLLRELDTAITGIMNEPGMSLRGSDELALWRRLNEPALPDEPILVVQGSTNFLVKLAQRYQSLARLPLWTIRPGANKLILRLSASDSAAWFVDKARALCTADGALAQIAGGDNEMLWRVWHLPAAAEGSREIIARLKNQFDAAGVFNPLVSF